MATVKHSPVKYCPKCHKTKQANLFHRNRCRPDGLSTYCAQCHRLLGRLARQQPGYIPKKRPNRKPTPPETKRQQNCRYRSTLAGSLAAQLSSARYKLKIATNEQSRQRWQRKIGLLLQAIARAKAKDARNGND